MAFNLDKGKQNAKDINSILSDINQKQEASLKIERERLKIEKERLATDKQIKSEQDDINNVIKDQLKQLKFQKAEKSTILKSTNAINRISENLASFQKSELASSKALAKLGKDRLEIEPLNIRTKSKLEEFTVFDAIRDNKGKGIKAKDFFKAINKTL